MSIIDSITDRINDFERRTVFFSNDFLDIASAEIVRDTLKELNRAGVIRIIIDEYYYKPQYSTLVEEYEAFSIEQVAIAIARKHKWTIVPSQMDALNLLGLSTQVPAKWVYISSGPEVNYCVGRSVIEFRRGNPEEIVNISRVSAIVIQAIRGLGENNVSDRDVSIIRSRLSDEARRLLFTETKAVSPWIYEIILKITEN